MLKGRVTGALVSVALILGALATPATAQDEPRMKVNFISSLYQSIIYYNIIAAQELGYFEKEGVEVNMMSSSASIPFVAFIANGQADITKLDSTEVINAAAANIPVSVIFEMMQIGVDSIAVAEDSPITDITQLKGKTIGLTTDRDRPTLAKKLHRVGLTLDDVKTAVLGESGPTLANAFRNKTVDAVEGAPTDWLNIQANGIKVRLVSPPDLNPGNLFVINKDRTEEIREPITAFLRAWVKGAIAIHVDKEAVIAMLKKAVPDEWEREEFARQYLETAIQVHTPVTERYGDLRPEIWTTLQDEAVAVGEITEKVDPATFLDDSFIAAVNEGIDRDQIKADIEEWKKNNGM